MKKTLSKIAILLVSMNLVSCSTNTQSQNTGLGAVTGAVAGGLVGGLAGGGAVGIGAGIVAGAVVGGLIGHSMDNSDHAHMNQSLNNQSNQSSHWTNSKTGTSYTITPTSKKISYHGNPNCRSYTAVATMQNGKTHRTHGVACMQANGSWKAVSG